MTQRANPSINRPIEAYKSAGAIALAGGSRDGWISPSSEYSDISKQDPAISEEELNEFQALTLVDSTTVTIDPGEAFVWGSWIVKDQPTDVSLAANTTDQTVYLGWDNTESNEVIIGTVSAFSDSDNDIDQKIPLYDFDTDSNGVTNTTDRRTIGKEIITNSIEVAEKLQIPTYSNISNALPEESSVIYIDGSQSDVEGFYIYTNGSYRRVRRTDSALLEKVLNDSVTSGSGDITLNYDTNTNVLTISGPTQYTDEKAQDAVSSAISTDSSINTSYDDANDDLLIEVIDSSITTDELDESISPTWSGDHTFNNPITQLSSPSADEHTATKQYVDSKDQGLDIKEAVRVASTSSIDTTSSTDPNPIDGVTLSDGDRILLKDQTDATENGIYVTNTATDPTTWTRAPDADEDSEVTEGLFVFVSEGDVQASQGYALIGSNVTLGSDDLQFTKFSDAGTLSAGDALTKSGDVISHVDTSSQSNFTSSDGAAITDIDFDEQGHTTSVSETDFDQRYLESAGDTLTGELTVTGSVDASQASEIISATYTSLTDAENASLSEGVVVYIADEEDLYINTSTSGLLKLETFEEIKNWVNNNASVPEADVAKGFESRTDYPSNPDSGRVVFRTDKT